MEMHGLPANCNALLDHANLIIHNVIHKKQDNAAMRSEVAEQKQELRAESGISAIKALCDITNRLIYSTARFSIHVEERTKEAKRRLLSFLEFE